MAAKKSDLLKCKTKAEVKAFAKDNNLPVRGSGSEIQVGGWICIFSGNKFQYVK